MRPLAARGLRANATSFIGEEIYRHDRGVWNIDLEDCWTSPRLTREYFRHLVMALTRSLSFGALEPFTPEDLLSARYRSFICEFQHSLIANPFDPCCYHLIELLVEGSEVINGAGNQLIHLHQMLDVTDQVQHMPAVLQRVPSLEHNIR